MHGPACISWANLTPFSLQAVAQPPPKPDADEAVTDGVLWVAQVWEALLKIKGIVSRFVA